MLSSETDKETSPQMELISPNKKCNVETAFKPLNHPHPLFQKRLKCHWLIFDKTLATRLQRCFAVCARIFILILVIFRPFELTSTNEYIYRNRFYFYYLKHQPSLQWTLHIERRSRSPTAQYHTVTVFISLVDYPSVDLEATDVFLSNG